MWGDVRPFIPVAHLPCSERRARTSSPLRGDTVSETLQPKPPGRKSTRTCAAVAAANALVHPYVRTGSGRGRGERWRNKTTLWILVLLGAPRKGDPARGWSRVRL